MADPINNQKAATGNFIITTFKFSEAMEESAQAYVKGAREKGKDIESSWQARHKTKAEKQLELAQQSKYMAWVSTFLLVTTVATTVGSTVIGMHGGANNPTAKLLGDIGGLLSNQGNNVAQNISGMYTQPINATIDELNQSAQQIWESKKRENESREEALKSIQEKASSATQSATERLGQAFSLRG